jgi:predicted HicB family RNase H-like nuclease
VASKKTTDTEDKKRGLMLRLPPNLHTALRHVSIDRGQSLNTLITEVLEQWWGQQPERRKYKA